MHRGKHECSVHVVLVDLKLHWLIALRIVYRDTGTFALDCVVARRTLNRKTCR
jgi:hypothetical protein